MFDSQLIAVSTNPVPLEPPGSSTDYRPGYSGVTNNPHGHALKVGGPTRQVFTIAAGVAGFPINDIEPEERLWVKTVSGSGQIETLWQGIVAAGD